jgi:hypothetical protein
MHGMLFHLSLRSRKEKLKKNFELVDGEHSSRYKVFLRAQTRLKPRRKVETHVNFPSPSQSPDGLITIPNMTLGKSLLADSGGQSGTLLLT